MSVFNDRVVNLPQREASASVLIFILLNNGLSLPAFLCIRIRRFIVDSKVAGTLSHVQLLISFTPNEKKTTLRVINSFIRLIAK